MKCRRHLVAKFNRKQAMGMAIFDRNLAHGATILLNLMCYHAQEYLPIDSDNAYYLGRK